MKSFSRIALFILIAIVFGFIGSTLKEIKIDTTLTQNFLYPAIISVLASIFSFLGSYFLSKRNSDSDKRTRAMDLIDYLIIEFNNLVVSLDKLSKDVESLNYFSFANINRAIAIVGKLKSKTEQIILFSDESLRKQLIETIDQTSYVVDEINNIEYLPVNEKSKAESIKAERLKEFRTICSELLKAGIYIDRSDNYKPKDFRKVAKGEDETKRGEVIKSVESLLNELVADMNESDANLERINKENEKRRALLVIRILDIQTKYRELTTRLSTLKPTL